MQVLAKEGPTRFTIEAVAKLVDVVNPPSIDGGPHGLRCYWRSTIGLLNMNCCHPKEWIWRRISPSCYDKSGDSGERSRWAHFIA